MKNRRGFTLVELLIVIVVIAILASISVVAYNGIQVRARDTQREQDINTISKALELYYIDNGHFPPARNGGTLINDGWTTSVQEGAWGNLQSHLSDQINTLPVDPKNTHTNGVHSPSQLDTEFHYAYFATDRTFCGKNNPDWNVSNARPQMYLLVYQYEGRDQKNTFSGECPPTTLQYNHASNYRVVK